MHPLLVLKNKKFETQIYTYLFKFTNEDFTMFLKFRPDYPPLCLLHFSNSSKWSADFSFPSPMCFFLHFIHSHFAVFLAVLDIDLIALIFCGPNHANV